MSNTIRSQKRVVLLNGPSKCGKDTIAQHLVPYFAFASMKFASPIKRMAAALLDMDVSAVERHKEAEFNILCKEILSEDFGVSPEYGPKDTLRQLLIRISEEFLKPTYGDTFFGRIAVRELQRSAYPLAIFTDSGFYKEASSISRSVGHDNVLLIRIHREGYDFTGDSRTYIEGVAGREVDIINGGTIRECVFRVASAIRGYFGIELLRELEM